MLDLVSDKQGPSMTIEPEPAKIVPTPTRVNYDKIAPDPDSFELDSEAASKIDFAVQQLNLNSNMLHDESMTPSNRSFNSSVLSQRRQQHYMAK